MLVKRDDCLCPLMTRDPSHPVLCAETCMLCLPAEGGWVCALNSIAASLDKTASAVSEVGHLAHIFREDAEQ